MHHPSASPESRFLRQALAGAAFLGLVAVSTLSAARGGGPVGALALWLPGLPLLALAALALAGSRGHRDAPASRPAPASSRRRARLAQARRRAPARPAHPRRRAAA